MDKIEIQKVLQEYDRLVIEFMEMVYIENGSKNMDEIIEFVENVHEKGFWFNDIVLKSVFDQAESCNRHDVAGYIQNLIKNL